MKNVSYIQLADHEVEVVWSCGPAEPDVGWGGEVIVDTVDGLPFSDMTTEEQELVLDQL
jgi:nitrogenase subunit NifH